MHAEFRWLKEEEISCNNSIGITVCSNGCSWDWAPLLLSVRHSPSQRHPQRLLALPDNKSIEVQGEERLLV